jgi:hypothetical protein
MPNLTEFQAMASIAPTKSVTLSPSTMALLRCALEYVESPFVWQGEASELTPSEEDYIDGVSALAAYELTQDAQVAMPYKYASIVKQVSSGTAGGATVANQKTNMTGLSTIIDPDGIVLENTGSAIRLPVGLYKMTLDVALVTSSTVNHARLFIDYNDGEYWLQGLNQSMQYSNAGAIVPLLGVLNVTNEAHFIRPQYYVLVARATNGLGVPMSVSGTNERYVHWLIEQVG